MSSFLLSLFLSSPCCSVLIIYVDLLHGIADGLWNYIEAEEVAEVINDCLTAHREYSTQLQQDNQTLFQAVSEPPSSSACSSLSPPPTPAECLLTRCQQNAALSAGLSLNALLDLPSGPAKRNILDDITIIVLFSPTPAPTRC